MTRPIAKASIALRKRPSESGQLTPRTAPEIIRSRVGVHRRHEIVTIRSRVRKARALIPAIGITQIKPQPPTLGEYRQIKVTELILGVPGMLAERVVVERIRISNSPDIRIQPLQAGFLDRHASHA